MLRTYIVFLWLLQSTPPIDGQNDTEANCHNHECEEDKMTLEPEVLHGVASNPLHERVITAIKGLLFIYYYVLIGTTSSY